MTASTAASFQSHAFNRICPPHLLTAPLMLSTAVLCVFHRAQTEDARIRQLAGLPAKRVAGGH